MVIGVKIPKMGQATVEVDVIAWHVSVGDTVVPGTVLAEIESEKTTIELAAEIAGTIEEILVGEGEETHVGAVICRIAPTA
jgi:pyruvate/2-oxoglutarate dehydrogenase complex dihydrolipoamide acyltransferase (E2) component